MNFSRVLTSTPDNVNWTKTSSIIKDAEGKNVFELANVEAPDFWSENAINIVASKYFKKINGVQETSIKQLIKRVVDQICNWGVKQNYFDSNNESIFRDELTYLLVHQMACFNSPIWFNFGVPNREQQAAACFLLGLEDNSESIRNWTSIESKIFKGGSGSGINLSSLRHKNAPLSTGGFASGPMSFAKSADCNAGIWKSGGATRRAATLRRMDVTHPDIKEFITCKSKEEKKAKILIDAGYSDGIDGEAYTTVAYQNMNHSVGVTDKFMQKVMEGEEESVAIIKLMAQCAWDSGDPGIQYHDTINAWNTLPNSGSITTSNPCQPSFATVLTPKGIRTFNDIFIGEIIWSGNQWTTVTNKTNTGVKSVYKYTTRAGTFIGTETHKIVSSGTKIEVKEAEMIDRSLGNFDGLLLETYSKQAIMDGLVIGDGESIKANNGANEYEVLHIGTDDQSYFDSEIKDLIKNKFDDTAYLVTTTIDSSELLRTFDRYVPIRYFNATKLIVASFLRGLYSANGSICGKRVTLKATSLKLIEQVQQMLSMLGIGSYYTINKPKEVEFINGKYLCRESYDLNISIQRNLFRELIGFIQPEKINKLNKICETVSFKEKTTYEIVESEYLGEFSVYDLTVDCDEHTYWTGGLLVSNCGEYLSTDWSSCLLASFNLLKYVQYGAFDYSKFKHAVDIFTTALDIIIDNADYPDERFKDTAHRQRQLGLGYSNLGALLMNMGIAYGSDEGRDLAARITSSMTAESYLQSAKIAKELGPFEDWTKNSNEMRDIINKHYKHAAFKWGVDDACTELWSDAFVAGSTIGWRNATTTLIAPTGTISFMMDCDTTGVEPEFSLIKYKKLVGGGTLSLVNHVVVEALKTLNYQEDDINRIYGYIQENGNVDNCPELRDYHHSVFACAVKTKDGHNYIRYQDHLEMVAAIQPFVSMGVSKTINMPHEATVDDIFKLYIDGWKKGIKSITIYRDGSKQSQPLNVGHSKTKEETKNTAVSCETGRRKLPDERQSITHKLEIAGFEGYIHVGLFEDGTPGELFITSAKSGSTMHGLLDSFATAISFCLQYGVPLEFLCDKFINSRFEPAGFTKHPQIKITTSITDYVFRWLKWKFIETKESKIVSKNESNGESLCFCGSIMVTSGTCHTCPNCGTVSGGCG